MGKLRFWIMEHNPATFYDDWKDRIWRFVTWPFFKCHECFDGYYYPSYGVAPHWHNIKKTGSFIGSTELYEKKEWPSNYDDVDDGCGMYYCTNPKCANSRPE